MRATNEKIRILNKWCSSNYNYYYKNTFVENIETFEPWWSRGYIKYEKGYEKLADLLVIPRLYLTDSRMPKDFTLEKTVTIPLVGQVTFYIYESGKKFVRVWMDCPFCGKRVSVKGFSQHAVIHTV